MHFLLSGCFVCFLMVSVFYIDAKSQPVKYFTENFVYKAPNSDGPAKPNPADFAKRVTEAKVFCKENRLNTNTAIFVDLGLHSDKYRCFVVRISDGAIRQKGMVTHGSGKTGLLQGERKYSNEEGSLLSALGKYKIGKSYQGQFGLAYKLHGLEATNSNAFSRYIVLHGHECVTDTESEELLCQSWGCPTVSPAFLLSLKKVIENTPGSLLLWIYDSTNK
jgi:hypothetical protein